MRFVLPNHVLRTGMAILDPMAQNWFAGEASRIDPLRELTVLPRRRFDDEAGLVGAVMEATRRDGGHRDGRPACRSKRTASRRGQRKPSGGPRGLIASRAQ